MRIFTTFILALFVLSGLAQVSSESVLVTVQGRPVTVGEFLYAYNKNGSLEGAVEKKTLEEYLEMYINYKLKVADALNEKMDTLKSFQEEFRTYRDMQLYPYMIDSAFVDSVALSVYNRTKQNLGGMDLIRPAHILLYLPQHASEEACKAAAVKADSIYSALNGGSDFAELAKKHSQDPGSAKDGGMLPWIGPGNTLKEFENAAYKLQVGEMSAPVLSPVGYHIILMKERKALEPFEVLKPEILSILEQQGIADAAAESTIRRYEAAGTPREEVIEKVIEERTASNPDLKYLIQEYYDGLLSYEAANKNVYAPASEDAALEAQFKANRKNYKWQEPRFKGYLYQCKDKKLAKKVKSFLKKNVDKEGWKKLLKQTFNNDSLTVKVSGPYLAKKGDNVLIDQCVFKGKKSNKDKRFPVIGTYGKKLKKPEQFVDVKADVTADLHRKLEQEYVTKLRQKFEVTKNMDVVNALLENEK